MTTLYIDTNIFIDAIKNRKNKFGKNIGEPAMDMFIQAASCKFRIVISSWALQEMTNELGIDDTKSLFALIRKKIDKVYHDEKDIIDAKIISPDHFQDALHWILAQKSKADVLVTRNRGHFKFNKIRIAYPEELI